MARTYECERCHRKDDDGSDFVMYQGEQLLCADAVACRMREFGLKQPVLYTVTVTARDGNRQTILNQPADLITELQTRVANGQGFVFHDGFASLIYGPGEIGRALATPQREKARPGD